MDHDLIVEQLLARCKGFIETILQASDLHRVATASLAIFEQIRPVAREILQAKITVERNRTRIRYQESWHSGLAVGSGAVEGACKHVIQSRFKRAGMRWKPPGFLHVLALRLARLNGTFQAFWASRGLVIQTSV